jgi:hypothetical protein
VDPSKLCQSLKKSASWKRAATTSIPVPGRLR